MIYPPGHPHQRPTFARAEGLTPSQMTVVGQRLRAAARSLSLAAGEEAEPHLWLRECRAERGAPEMPGMAVATVTVGQTEPGGLMAVAPSFGSRLVDALLGCEAAGEARSLSEVDLAVLGDWLQHACTRLLGAVAAGRTLPEVRLGKLRVNPRPPDAMGEHVLAGFSQAPEGDSVLELRLPAPTARRLAGLEAAPAGPRARVGLEAALRRLRLRLQARLLVTELPAADVLNLAVGDVIVLDTVPEESAELLVNGRPKFSGRAGVMQGLLSFEVAAPIEEGEAE